MKVNETILGSIGVAVLAYVAHITGHPSICSIFLGMGITYVIVEIVNRMRYDK